MILSQGNQQHLYVFDFINYNLCIIAHFIAMQDFL